MSPVSFSQPWTPSAPPTPAQPLAPQAFMSAPMRTTPQQQPNNAPPPGQSMRSSSSRAPGLDSSLFMIDPQLMVPGGHVRNEDSNPSWQGYETGNSQGQPRHQYPGIRADQSNAYSSRTWPSIAGVYPSSNDASAQGHGSSMPLPYPIPPSDFNWSEQHRAKRVKLGPFADSRNTLPPVFTKPELPDSVASNASQYDQASPGSVMFTPFSANSTANTPGTPGSSIASEETASRVVPRPSNLSVQHTPDLRRLSVNSLLSGPPGDYDAHECRAAKTLRYPKTDDEGSTYGYDYGYPDLDVSKNNDSMAIIPQSPAAVRSRATSVAESPYAVASEAPSPTPTKEAAFQRGGYYAQPVPIKISKEFEPLPSYLADSPMNLLYFHHFLNHTARVLTPHDCPDNPLRTILPKSVSNLCCYTVLLLTNSQWPCIIQIY